MIIDSSSLIILAKLNRLDLLSNLYTEILITQGIYQETVEEGIAINAPDAKLIEKAMQNKKIRIIELIPKHSKFSEELRNIYSQLGIGESDAISLALQEKQKTIIMDEKFGRQVCKLYKIRPIGTLRVILEAYKNNIIKEQEFKDIIKGMIESKFRIGADVITEFWNIFEKLKKRKRS
ncbi:DUF3368 domain-containing protein [Candidatus Pacearchaeota archaeon]|nr:DUF3368 domain-containing protein [Candidatus Pacearchaeota archaeon]